MLPTLVPPADRWYEKNREPNQVATSEAWHGQQEERPDAYPYSSPKFSPPLPGGTLPKSPEGRARETLRWLKCAGRYVDGQGWKHASSRDEPSIPAVTRLTVE